jgi:large subunit ribosomal protein L11
MAKKVTANLKLRVPAGKASAGPPVGSTLGQYGLNMMDFINPFNEATKEYMGSDVIVKIRVYDDRTFDFRVSGIPTDDLIRKEAGIQKGSAKPHSDKVAKITVDQLKKIAEIKQKVSNADDIEMTMRQVAGTARSMGVEVDGYTKEAQEATPEYVEEVFDDVTEAATVPEAEASEEDKAEEKK